MQDSELIEHIEKIEELLEKLKLDLKRKRKDIQSGENGKPKQGIRQRLGRNQKPKERARIGRKSSQVQ